MKGCPGEGDGYITLLLCTIRVKDNSEKVPPSTVNAEPRAQPSHDCVIDLEMKDSVSSLIINSGKSFKLFVLQVSSYYCWVIVMPSY